MNADVNKSTTQMPLARRLIRRAVDVLVIGFVITVGLSVGPQLVEWWRADTDAVSIDLSALNGTELDWNRSPVTLRFGDASTSIERIPFQGQRDQIQDELTKIGKALVNSTKTPQTRMQEAERDWLDALRLAPPVFWDSTEGNVYWRAQPLPSIVATRFVETGSGDPRQTGPGSGDSSQTRGSGDPYATDGGVRRPAPNMPNGEPAPNRDAVEDTAEGMAESSSQRIVGWGLAFPAASNDWTIYVFRPNSARSPERTARKGIAIPGGAANVTQLIGANGSQWQVFQGRGDLSSWVQHFDDYFGAAMCTGRSVDSQVASLKFRIDQVTADVQIRREPDGNLTGVIWSAEQGDSR